MATCLARKVSSDNDRVVGAKGETMTAELFLFRRHTLRWAAVGGYGVWQAVCPGPPSAVHQRRGNPPRSTQPTLSPVSLTSPSAQPACILTRLFPPRMGAQPHRHGGAQPSLGTSVRRGKPKTSPPGAAGCGNRLLVSPLGSPRCGHTVSEKQGFRAGAARERWALSAWEQQAWKTCPKLR